MGRCGRGLLAAGRHSRDLLMHMMCLGTGGITGRDYLISSAIGIVANSMTDLP
jgi:hypothetical protein